MEIYFLATFWDVSDLFFSYFVCLQSKWYEVNPEHSTFLSYAPSCCLAKEPATEVKGCLGWAAFLTLWRHRTKYATFVFIPRLRSIWGQNPWPTRADDEPQHELRVRVPANQSETLPLCQVGNGAFLTVICTMWATQLQETKATPRSDESCVLMNPSSSIHHSETLSLTILKKFMKC